MVGNMMISCNYISEGLGTKLGGCEVGGWGGGWEEKVGVVGVWDGAGGRGVVWWVYGQLLQ